MKKISSHYSVVIAILVVVTMTSMCQAVGSNVYPLILVPGNGGNQLEVRLDREYKPSSVWCSSWLYPIHKKSGGWFRLWFDAAVLLSPFTRCFSDRMMLYYDPDLDDYQNAPGVQTRVPHFGSTKSLLYLDPRLRDATSYMEHLVKALEKKCGYVNDQTILGAPYDFRYGLAASGHPSRVASQFLQDLKQLVEKTSSENEGKPVILLSHSLGGLFVLHFLNRTTPSWRRKYIKHFVALAAPWGGTISQMKTFASGNTLGVPLVNPLLVRRHQRTSESNQWLLPSTKVFHDRTKPLVVTPQVNYTAYEMDRFFADIGFSQGVVPYKTRVLPLTEELMTPGVPVTCIYGRGVDTPEVLMYGKGGFDKQPEIKYGDGDGTVNLASLAALKVDSLNTVEIDGVSHTSILKDEIALKEIMKQISIINYELANVNAVNE
ncbi:F17L21.27 [Arabidopsis thaliana]|jgi:lysophospholipase-3|uniref:Lecithin-cholesterol acyltransferase-like 1 n=3 Tax=Arabidopsis TaxID=3701 RepID=LCAT1_ARATH|nr:alpha/beta-Hydrolases superfamily protein [Arabidopsis thaliana]Q9FZI8.1 RecName: Full=Lecithin-cholesterol acyltransferase-like 1 [Arabidopsis thaliana]KAG7655654.1 Alpha/Beta hydrolase fold [Arabidopsis suecica]AAF99739.1 F17L21.27 [Arabidopsis thaliana]AAK32913.1 At1g27480/F17L21_28 [Arabidopsis thaliana]AAM64980.1 unknown [Arabidopsis thaliana]AAM91444.1 At1g27480/F17L21_28 [Arabidopsis thaliana]|eukprot:NP_564286.1 alpha/beta-Hydrolases superfamily protein [Arabidopsis thaliana]